MSDDPTERLNAALEGRYRIERELGEGIGRAQRQGIALEWGRAISGDQWLIGGSRPARCDEGSLGGAAKPRVVMAAPGDTSQRGGSNMLTD